LEAARVQFSGSGWSATGIRDIASMAGVSIETVYANFGSKTQLLQAALDIAVAGDDRPIPLAKRPEFGVLASGRLEERAQAAARLLSSVHSHTKGLQRALREAAASDPDLEQVLRTNEEHQRADIERGAQLVYGRPPTQTLRDALWALSSFELYELLVERSGWSEPRYENWLAEMFVHFATD
jgi:AcrR family transcriptional regulator